MIKFLILLVASASLTAGSPACRAAGPSPMQIKNLVTFGDSYTDVVSRHKRHAQIHVSTDLHLRLPLQTAAQHGRSTLDATADSSSSLLHVPVRYAPTTSPCCPLFRCLRLSFRSILRTRRTAPCLLVQTRPCTHSGSEPTTWA